MAAELVRKDWFVLVVVKLPEHMDSTVISGIDLPGVVEI